MRTAFITGITGQDGSYLAELLLDKGYEVHGLVRRASLPNTDRIAHLASHMEGGDARLLLHYGDLTDASSLNQILRALKPDEVYHLGAQSHVGVSFEKPEYTANVTALGTQRLLEAMRDAGLAHTKFYQASTSELFGKVKVMPQTEETPFYPRNPYAAAKIFGYWIAKNYREAYGMFACNGILFNHESERRGDQFVTRKITLAVARILAGKQQKLYLGNLEAQRDWGYAPEYVEAMWRILQHDEPEDFVIATGEMRSVREFVEEAFGLAGLDWKKHVEVDERQIRPSETDKLCGDASKAKRLLGWEPQTRFQKLVRIMLKHDLAREGCAEAAARITV